MEVEAKYVVPNREQYRELLRLRELAGYTLVPAGTVAKVLDRYLDTSDGRVLNGGYALRLRSEGDSVLVTLKGLGDASGAVHRRDEQEVALPEWTSDVTEWPEGSARALALELTGGRELQHLFELAQRRARREVMDGERLVAELSLDDVRAAVGRRPAFYYEVEVELAPDGTEADLAALSEALQMGWGLAPEPRSKFQRALATLQERGAPITSHLNQEERNALSAIASGGDPEMARRAAVVLAWSEGLPTREIVARTGLSAGRVRFWLRAFRAQRMGIFHEPVNSPGEPMSDASVTSPQSAEQGREPGRKRQLRRRSAPTVRQFCRSNRVDMAHARYVAALVGSLFDALRPIHGLPRKRRRLLRQAAILYYAGAIQDPEHPHRAGRDLILAQPLRDVSTSDRLVLAALVALNRNRVRLDREPAIAALDQRTREQVRAMTALLHVADALDFSRTQSTLIERLDSEDGARIEITLAGPAAEVDALQAASRADLWYEVFGQELIFAAQGAHEDAGPAPGPVAVEEPPKPAREAEPFSSAEPMSEAGRKIIRFHFGRMLDNEAGTRQGDDIEALHDMRVATRRMRAAFQVFDPYYKDDAIRPHIKGLRRTGRALGSVRDLDVLIEKAHSFGESLPPELQESFQPLIAHWEVARDVARRQMLEYLDGQAYRGFTDEFEKFLTTTGAGALDVPSGEPVPHLVRHVAPQLIHERYEAVRAYDTLLPGAPLTTYHQLRIDFKRLRYALEFFKDVLGPEATAIIKQVTGMQDLLGELQDAHVAEGLIEEFLAEQGKRKRRSPNGEKKTQSPALEGVQRYLEYQRSRQEQLLEGFDPAWADIIGYDFRRDLGLAVAAV
jgi:CHAD domain-containing protein